MSTNNTTGTRYPALAKNAGGNKPRLSIDVTHDRTLSTRLPNRLPKRLFAPHTRGIGVLAVAFLSIPVVLDIGDRCCSDHPQNAGRLFSWRLSCSCWHIRMAAHCSKHPPGTWTLRCLPTFCSCLSHISRHVKSSLRRSKCVMYLQV